jgi:hypothetical protein
MIKDWEMCGEGGVRSSESRYCHDPVVFLLPFPIDFHASDTWIVLQVLILDAVKQKCDRVGPVMAWDRQMYTSMARSSQASSGGGAISDYLPLDRWGD